MQKSKVRDWQGKAVIGKNEKAHDENQKTQREGILICISVSTAHSN